MAVAYRRMFLALTSGLVAESVNRIFPIIIIHYVASRIGVERFGFAQVGMQIIDLAIVFIIFGYPTMAAVKIGKAGGDREKIRRIVSEITALKLIHAVIALVLVLFLTNFSDHYRQYNLIVLSLGFLLFSTALDMSYVHLGTQRMASLSMITTGAKPISLIAIVLLVETPEDAVLYAVLSMGANALVSLINFSLSLKRFPFCKVSFKDLQNLLLQAFPFAACTLLVICMDRIDLFLVEKYHGTSGAGLYAAATRLVLSLISIMSALSNIFFSEMLASSSEKSLRQHLGISFKGLFLFFAPIACGVWFVAPELLNLIVGEEFLGASRVLCLLVVSTLAQILLFVFGVQYLQVKRWMKKLNFSLLGGLILSVGLMIHFQKIYGMDGIAAGVLVGKMVTGLVLLYFARSTLKELGWLSLVKILGAAALMSGALAFTSLPGLWLNLLLGAVVYLGCLFVLGRSELAGFFNALQKRS